MEKYCYGASASSKRIIITAGSTYLDIDAYACCVAMQELLELKGVSALAYSQAPGNYSICPSLVETGQILKSLPEKYSVGRVGYVIVDVSDPEYIGDEVPLDQVVAVYDHHTGFEEYWHERIGNRTHIEFIGAAATLIYREWKRAGMQERMTRSTALLLIAAILDNTLNLTSSNTTDEDWETFYELCRKEKIDEKWCADYFSEVQDNIEADLRTALFRDLKTVRGNAILPEKVAQICLWDVQHVLDQLPKIRQWFNSQFEHWMINVIEIKNHCSYFICDDLECQKKIEKVFDVHFEAGIARVKVSYLRKELIKITAS